jgi:hypothetical protein
MPASDAELPREDRLALIVLAVAQSLALLLLHKSLTHEVWPATDPRWLYALYAVTVGVPVFLYAAAVRWRERENAYAAGALAVLLFWIGWHLGWLEAPYYAQQLGDGEFTAGFVFSMGLVLFIAAFYFRSWREAGRFDYPRLLDNSWRNALAALFLVGFLAVFALLLLLWAALFRVIEIRFFAELFTKSEFVYPVGGLVGGWGLGLIRARVGMVATVRRLCEVLIRALLPLVAFILVIFLATLPVTGLAALWDTGYAATLLVSLAAILLFFFNAMVADDEAISLHRWLQPLVLVALVLVPVNAALAAWSLYLRVDQYGWTVDRLWAGLVIGWVAVYALGYAAIVLYRRGMDVGLLRRLNTVLGVLLALDLFAVNTPQFDFHRIAANSQVERLLDGRTKPADFDARYLRFGLGPYGIRELEALKVSDFAKAQSGLVTMIMDALTATSRWTDPSVALQSDPEALRTRFIALPGTELDDEFLQVLVATREHGGNVMYCFQGTVACTVGDFVYRGQRYRAQTSHPPYASGQVWRRDGAQWVRIGSLRQFGCPDKKPAEVDTSAPFTPVESEFFVLENGVCLYQVLPDRAAL